MKSHLNNEDAGEVGIYAVINEHTGETYSGSGILGKCLSRHKRGYTNGNHDNANLREAFKRTPEGWNFYPVVINEPGNSKEENREIAFDLEQEDINSFIGDPLFLNISTDARKCRPVGIEHSEETKNKMSKTHTTRVENLSEEEKKVMAQTAATNLSGYIEKIKESGTPKQTREKQSTARLELFKSGYVSPLRGTSLSEQTKEKIRETCKENWQNLPEEVKQARSEKLKSHLVGNKFTLGMKQSAEVIEHRRAANTGKIRDEEARKNIRAGIIKNHGVSVTVDGQRFETYTDAAKAYGVNIQTVVNRVNSNTERFKNWGRSDER